MNTSKIQLLSKPELSSPTFVLGLGDQYGINSVVTQTLIDHTQAEKFAELYSPHFPDSAISEESGLCHLPAYEIYGSSRYKPNVIVLSGEVIPDPGDMRAYYELVDLIAGFAEEQGCTRVLSFGAYHGEGAEDKIRVAASTGRLASTISGKLGGSPFVSGGVNGLVGMVVGAAKLRGIPAACVLAPFAEGAGADNVVRVLYHCVLDVLAVG